MQLFVIYGYIQYVRYLSEYGLSGKTTEETHIHQLEGKFSFQYYGRRTTDNRQKSN